MAEKSGWREFLSLTVVAAVLVTAVWFARRHAESLKEFIDHNPVQGVAVYIVLNILDAVIAPGATLPLIPIASRAWGHVAAALVTTVGWTAGSLVAFYIARRWGSPIVRKLTSMERVKRLRAYVPKDPFWSVVLLRLVLPMDVMSYVLGLFSEMSWPAYGLATGAGPHAVGVHPQLHRQDTARVRDHHGRHRRRRPRLDHLLHGAGHAKVGLILSALG